jgi:glycosyltransferase involved in cell wall biosynthesis
MDISVVIPLYNEAENLPLIYDAVKSVMDRTGKIYQVVLIDDGSTDASLKFLQGLAQRDPFVKIVCLDGHYGKASALDAGFKQAEGEIILTIDADLQYDPQDLVRILKELDNIDIDAVLGKRVERHSGWFKSFCSNIAIGLRNAVLGESWQDSSLAGYKRHCLERLTLYKDAQIFLPVFLKFSGCRITEINVKEHPRKHGRSKYGLQNRLFGRLYALFVIKWLKDNRLQYKIDRVLNEGKQEEDRSHCLRR